MNRTRMILTAALALALAAPAAPAAGASPAPVPEDARFALCVASSALDAGVRGLAAAGRGSAGDLADAGAGFFMADGLLRVGWVALSGPGSDWEGGTEPRARLGAAIERAIVAARALVEATLSADAGDSESAAFFSGVAAEQVGAVDGDALREATTAMREAGVSCDGYVPFAGGASGEDLARTHLCPSIAGLRAALATMAGAEGPLAPAAWSGAADDAWWHRWLVGSLPAWEPGDPLRSALGDLGLSVAAAAFWGAIAGDRFMRDPADPVADRAATVSEKRLAQAGEEMARIDRDLLPAFDGVGLFCVSAPRGGGAILHAR